ncbi:MAG: DUF11 domain-containing protein, partial [Thermoplasmata archaeon]|nr:DUF11 domain-containing protein [Thermoplasmata archaeon]
MSLRLRTSPLAGIFLLLLVGATLLPFFALPAAAFGERAYESNTVINGTTHQAVYSGESVAQSFTTMTSYRLVNLTLRLRNLGGTSNAINITIRSDAGGVPASTYLAWSAPVIGNGNLGNYAISFASPTTLASGVRYWIVATSSAFLSLSGYEWHDSGANTYPNGQAMLNSGSGWVNPSSPTDMYFVTYGQEVASNVTLKIQATKDSANPGEVITFRVYLNNTGLTAAGRTWVNDTELPELAYVSDTSASAGSTTPWPSFTFPAVGNGPRSFVLSARVDIQTEPGTILSKALTLVYVDGTGTLRTAPSTIASILVGRQTKQVYLDPKAVGSAERLNPAKPTGSGPSQSNQTLVRGGSAHDFDLDPVFARAFHVTGANVTLFLDSSTHDARNLDINLTLTDWNGVTYTPVAYRQQRVTTNQFEDYQAFVFALPASNHTFPLGGRIRLTVSNMPTSASDAILAMNSTFAASRIDLDATTYVRIDMMDMRDAKGSTTVWSPKDTLIVQANVSDPFGSPEIAGARLNLTSPSGDVIVNYTAMALFATDPASPSAWKLFRTTVWPSLSVGTYRGTVTATESNGVRDVALSSALVRAPAFSLAKTASAVNVRGGDRFTYDIWFNNTGTGPAGQVWINDSLPSGLTFLDSSDPGAMTGNYRWSWTALGPGNYRLSIDVTVNASLPAIPFFRNAVFLNYTDEKGFSWSTRTASVDVAYQGPVIALTMTSAGSVLH